jgi:hypothetical protein
MITLYNGGLCDIAYDSSGKGLVSSKIPIKDKLTCEAFNAAVEIVINSGGKAPKGNARSEARLGTPGLPLNSVGGYVAHKVRDVKVGQTAFGQDLLLLQYWIELKFAAI